MKLDQFLEQIKNIEEVEEDIKPDTTMLFKGYEWVFFPLINGTMYYFEINDDLKITNFEVNGTKIKILSDDAKYYFKINKGTINGVYVSTLYHVAATVLDNKIVLQYTADPMNFVRGLLLKIPTQYIVTAVSRLFYYKTWIRIPSKSLQYSHNIDVDNVVVVFLNLEVYNGSIKDEVVEVDKVIQTNLRWNAKPRYTYSTF